MSQLKTKNYVFGIWSWQLCFLFFNELLLYISEIFGCAANGSKSNDCDMKRFWRKLSLALWDSAYKIFPRIPYYGVCKFLIYWSILLGEIAKIFYHLYLIFRKEELFLMILVRSVVMKVTPRVISSGAALVLLSSDLTRQFFMLSIGLDFWISWTSHAMVFISQQGSDEKIVMIIIIALAIMWTRSKGKKKWW